jgi:hypothetical protein
MERKEPAFSNEANRVSMRTSAETPSEEVHKQSELLYALSRGQKERWDALVDKFSDKNKVFSFNQAKEKYGQLKAEGIENFAKNVTNYFRQSEEPKVEVV